VGAVLISASGRTDLMKVISAFGDNANAQTTNMETTWTDGVAETSEGSIGEEASNSGIFLKLHYVLLNIAPDQMNGGIGLRWYRLFTM
jgi:hypothetical protein